MKVLASAPRPAPTAAPQPFGRLLAEARAELAAPHFPPGLRRRALDASAAEVQQAVLGRARAEGHAEATRLRAVRSEGLAVTEGALEARGDAATRHEAGAAERLFELIARELGAEPPRPRPAPLPLPFAEPQPAPAAVAPERSRAALSALLERVESFARSGRQALALTLNDALAERVELERVGPRAIAVRLLGRDGPPPADAVSRVREALRARGLEVAALSVG